MEARIYGTECEYALWRPSTGGGSVRLLGEETFRSRQKALAEAMMARLRQDGRPAAGEFLGNGGRFYIDRGGHPEYATPECRSVRDLTAHEKAGDMLVQELVEAVRETADPADERARLHVLKNNTDVYGTTYGGHENYLAAPAVADRIQTLIPFLVTRQIFAGAGKITALNPHDRVSDSRFPYQISQRADFIDRVFCDRTSQVRGIINTRKREIQQSDQNRRLHIILGDSNLSECAIALKNGTAGVVLRMIEEDAIADAPALANPVAALKQISRDPHAPLDVENGNRRYTAMDIQAIYLENAHRFFASRSQSPDETLVTDLWSKALAGLEKLEFNPETGDLDDDPDDLKRRIDWVCKLWLLNRFRNARSLDWGDYRLKIMDLRYHDLDPHTGLYEKSRRLGLVDQLVSDEDIRRAGTRPPADTRARVRGDIIRKAAEKKIQVHVEGWDRLCLWPARRISGVDHQFKRYLKSAGATAVKMDDPFQWDNPAVFERIAAYPAR